MMSRWIGSTATDMTDVPQAKPLLRALAGEGMTPPPCWFMRQAGRYLPEYRALREKAGGFLEMVFDPPVAAEITLQPIRRFGLDAAILFADILVIPYALGQTVAFVEGEGPRLPPLDPREGLGGLSMAQLHARLAPIYETMARVRAGLPPACTAIGFAGAPWTVACYMVEGAGSRDFAGAKQMAFAHPEAFGALIDLIVDATAEYLVEQIRAGAEAVQLFDSWAGALPESAFAAWVTRPTRAIVKRVKSRAPGVPVIGFPRGAGLLYRDYVAAAGVDAVGLDPGVPVSAAGDLQGRMPVQGNLDPIWLLAGGQPMIAEAQRILAALAGGPFVFNLGHGILPATKPETVAALVDCVRGFKV